MHVLYYSSLCPDTPPFVAALQEAGTEYQAYDIHASMVNLKAFIRLRDKEEGFDAIKEAGMVGVPCLLTASGQVITSLQVLEDFLKEDLA